MRNLRYPQENAVFTTRYGGFRGVDLSTDALLVDERRSPWAPNLISDTGGMPEKRVGWQTHVTLDAPINGLFQATIEGESHLLAHGGTRLYELSGASPVVLREGLRNGKCTAVFMAGKLYLFTGAQYLCYDGIAVAPVVGKIPEVVIGRTPSGGGGTLLETPNLIEPKWMDGFLGDASAVEYQLSYSALDATPVSAQLLQADGTWSTVAEGAGLTVNRVTGKVTFATAPGVTPAAGQDNVRITAGKTRAGQGELVTKAKVVASFNDSVMFAAGAKRGIDVHSGWNDPTYWPEMGYDQVGTDETDIMGYLSVGEYLAVIKEDNEQDSTIFLRSAATVDGQTAYLRKPAVTGIGAVSRTALGTLRGEPLFLSRQGVFALTSNLLTSERMVQNRSYFVDRLLTREANLELAVTAEWDGYFLICVNARCYVLDGKQNKASRQQASDYVYECYHWDHVPAVCFMQRGGVLWFGTADGRVCRFSNDRTDMSRYSDDGAAVVASWSTRADDDGDFMRHKRLLRRGSGILIKPYTHSSTEILLETEHDYGFVAASARMDSFDFNDLDFARFSFNTGDKPQAIPLADRVRRYQTLQITARNAQPDEGFGVYGIIKRFCREGIVR
ncbi:MAG: hypothetical protein RR135_05950 [Oscillospiraceae bacterium]